MNKLRIKFLGNPKMFFNEKELKLPFIKAYGVMYSIGLEKNITRDKLCAYFWGDSEEKTAKKNLRNAVYTIRKETIDNLIVSPKRSFLMYSEEINLSSDVDDIINFNLDSTFSDEELIGFLEIYKGDFLEDFKYTDSEDFNSWVRYNQMRIKKLYISKLDKSISLLIDNQNYHLAELCCEKLIRIDEYEELGYQKLMNIYESQGKLKECSLLYSRLTDTLNEELSVEPSDISKEIYNKIILNKAGNRISNKANFFYGRKYEIDKMVNNYQGFIKDDYFHSYIISGEPGIGKTRLIEELGQYTNECTTIKVTCYDIESSFHYKLWDNIFEELIRKVKNMNVDVDENILNVLSQYFVSVNGLALANNGIKDFKYSKDVVEEYVIKFFNMLCRKNKIILFIDDIQWIDKNSLNLLEKILFFNKHKIMLVTTYGNSVKDEYERFYFNLFKLKKIEKIELKRFSDDETSDFIRRYMPKLKSYGGLIYKESEGNPLFIVEIINNIKSGLSLNNLSDKLVSTIGGRIINLDKESKNILSICSIFYKTFNIDTLSQIMSKTDLEIAEIVEDFINKNILEESINSNGELVLEFTHKKIREFVYNQISLSKRGILHSKIAGNIEKKLMDNQNDILYYSALIYHYKMCENKKELFKYKVLNLYRILDITHEVFPIFRRNRTFNYSQLYITELELETEFNELKKLFEHIKIFEFEAILDYYILFLFVIGRYHKNKGNQTEGVATLENMINIAKKYKKFESVLEGYIQLVQNAININDMTSMKAYISELELIKVSFKKVDIARFSIYKGYYEILNKSFVEGERVLYEAIDIFKELENNEQYILNVSAIYMYLGESKFMQLHYDDAFELFSKALNMCDENEDVSSLAIILSKLGIIKYCTGNKDEAMFYLSKSLKYFDKTIFIWGRVQTYYYLSKLYLERNAIQKSTKFLEQAKKSSKIFENKTINKKILVLQTELSKLNK